MSNEIQYVVTWAIKPGGLDAFKELANEAINLVRDNEPEMKGYQWYFNDDETTCYTAEWHTSSESMLAHLQNVGDVLAKILAYSDISKFDVFGNPNAQATEAVKGLGAQVYGYYDGFTR